MAKQQAIKYAFGKSRSPRISMDPAKWLIIKYLLTEKKKHNHPAGLPPWKSELTAAAGAVDTAGLPGSSAQSQLTPGNTHCQRDAAYLTARAPACQATGGHNSPVSTQQTIPTVLLCQHTGEVLRTSHTISQQLATQRPIFYHPVAELCGKTAW